MAVYSHSKISTFEQCPLKYKLRYIDKIIIPIRSVESFLGETVHSSLEWLYNLAKERKIPSLDELIFFYTEEWKKNFKEDILIVDKNMRKEDYYNKGIKFLIDYYLKNRPFDENTLEVEKEIYITLDKGKKYIIRGFIDRLAYNLRTKEYEVHDYKTSNSIPSKDKIETDRQLALYSIAVKEMFGKDKEVLLIWHYLAYNQRILSRRTNEQLEKLKRQIMGLIDEIESEKKFHPYVSRLCDWCEYRKMCPAWGNSSMNIGKEKQKELADFKEKDKVEKDIEKKEEISGVW